MLIYGERFMHLFAKKFGWMLLISTSIFTLGACSSIENIPTSLPVKTTATYPPEGTLNIKSPVPMQTSAAFPTQTAAEAISTNPTVLATREERNGILADVLSVAVSGDENRYQFAVEIRSPDSGCEQYADWWEVVSEEGELLYRRVLAHSHVAEQPFTRSGGPVAIDADTIVIVRSHMHPAGYGGAALMGSVASGFKPVQLEPDFASGLDQVDPLPSGCAF
jgi:hypothetical protein